MNYRFEKADKVSHQKPAKFKLETNLIGKKMAEHLAAGYKMIH